MENTRPIGVIGAMEVECALLRERMEGRTDQEHSGMAASMGTIGGVPVVVVQCGVGLVNAATCVQMLVDEFDVRALVNTGVAGSLKQGIGVCDMVVSVDAVQHDMDVVNLGYEPGQVPGMPQAFPADPRMRKAAVEAVRTAAPDVGVFEGRVASGQSFVREDAEKKRIVEEFGAVCCEMEGAAIAQASFVNKLPFVIVRAISDEANGNSSMTYRDFEQKAADNSARTVEAMVASLGEAQL